MTSTDLASILEELLDYAGTCVSDAAFGSLEDLKPIVELGVLLPVGRRDEVACEVCDEPHMASVIAVDGELRAVCYRSAIEFTLEKTPTILEVRVEPLLDCIARQLDRRTRRAQPPGTPFLWSLGSLEHLGLRVGIYFLLNAGDLERAGHAIEWLKKEPRVDAVAILTNDRRDLSALPLPWNGRILRLSECVTLDRCTGLALLKAPIAERTIPQQLLSSRGRGRPNSAYELAASLIPDVDQDGALRRAKGVRGRHRMVLEAARKKHGPTVTLSKEPCERAFQAYLQSSQLRSS